MPIKNPPQRKIRRKSALKAPLPPYLPDGLLHFVGAAHALIALAGMAFAIRADADALQLAVVLLVVVTAGSHGAVNGLVVHYKSLHIQESGDAPGSSMRAMAGDMRFCFLDG